MAQVNRSVATLRIIGENLIPNEISKLLKCEPSFAYSKGDVKVSKTTGRKLIRKTGMWQMRSTDAEPENIDSQTLEIFSKLSSENTIWDELSSSYEINLFCGIFLEKSNEGMDISSSTLTLLADRKVQLSLDIYGPDEEFEDA
ncbi:MAG: DUF4279 domain-containing protein [Kangiellaceae bacterium]|nr:DUF4279 domain-containing protein [Kangiellaceae bacterium]